MRSDLTGLEGACTIPRCLRWCTLTALAVSECTRMNSFELTPLAAVDVVVVACMGFVVTEPVEDFSHFSDKQE